MKRVPQPPINALTRRREQRGAWPGLVLSVAGLLAGFFGLGRLTDVETVQGCLALEKEINMAFAHGGVKEAQAKPSPPSALNPGQPLLSPEGLPLNLPATHGGGPLRFRIDTTAKDPCPT